MSNLNPRKASVVDPGDFYLPQPSPISTLRPANLTHEMSILVDPNDLENTGDNNFNIPSLSDNDSQDPQPEDSISNVGRSDLTTGICFSSEEVNAGPDELEGSMGGVASITENPPLMNSFLQLKSKVRKSHIYEKENGETIMVNGKPRWQCNRCTNRSTPTTFAVSSTRNAIDHLRRYHQIGPEGQLIPIAQKQQKSIKAAFVNTKPKIEFNADIFRKEAIVLPILGNLTRWSSDYESLKRALRIKTAITSFIATAIGANRNGERAANEGALINDDLSDNVWMTLAQIMEILEPFAE
ncbi:hypothetical protein HOY82DRAFT_536203 [Tuber indicum]|nr:hypothetical protein HOY82DRAFT_536203 [Tuber indicum]